MKYLIALCLAGVLSVVVLAKDIAYVACTLSSPSEPSQAATLLATFNDDVQHSVVASIGVAFGVVANQLVASELVGPIGYQLFMGQLTESERQSFGLMGPPVLSDSPACK